MHYGAPASARGSAGWAGIAGLNNKRIRDNLHKLEKARDQAFDAAIGYNYIDIGHRKYIDISFQNTLYLPRVGAS
jgi:hypothetical protein